MTTQGTRIYLTLCLTLCGGRVAFISPNMRRDMVPWSISRVTDPPPDAISISPTEKGPVHIPNRKEAGPYPQLERAIQKAWIRAPYQKWPKKMPGVRLARRHPPPPPPINPCCLGGPN